MGNYTGGARAICPFYQREAGLSVTCEGAEGCSNLMIRFASKEEKRRWQIRFCETFSYLRCPFACTLDRQYGRDYGQKVGKNK